MDEKPSERVKMFNDPKVTIMQSRNNNMLSHIIFNSDGVIIDRLHTKIEDNFGNYKFNKVTTYYRIGTPRVNTVWDLDNLIPDANDKRPLTKLQRMMNHTITKIF